MWDSRWLTCPECRDESVFQQPPCADGHGLDCPEWFCASCGFAVFAGGSDIYNDGDINDGDIDDSAIDGSDIDDSDIDDRNAITPSAAARAGGVRWHAA